MGEMWVFSAQDLIPNEQCKDLTFEKLLLDQILFGHFMRALEATNVDSAGHFGQNFCSMFFLIPVGGKCKRQTARHGMDP
jgi:hypothetical protein